jgi:hypothetical protein
MKESNDPTPEKLKHQGHFMLRTKFDALDADEKHFFITQGGQLTDDPAKANLARVKLERESPVYEGRFITQANFQKLDAAQKVSFCKQGGRITDDPDLANITSVCQ